MADSKKPADPNARPGKSSGPLFRRDDYQASELRPREVATEAAPEVSQGAWRERAFVPRGVMAPEAVLAGLEAALAVAANGKAPIADAPSLLARDWLPLLRQALEQAGGDGLDAWLLRLLKPPGRAAHAPLFDALAAGFRGVRAAADPAALQLAGRAVIASVHTALAEKKRVSFKVLERELDGKLEVDELLAVRLATPEELAAREDEVAATLESLRLQAKAQRSGRPDGIYSNHARLKAELRVIQAERAARSL